MNSIITGSTYLNARSPSQYETQLMVWEETHPEFQELIEDLREIITHKDILNKSIHELKLSCRPHNCILSKDIRTIGELVGKNPYELLFIKNMGIKSVEEIMTKLYQLSWEIINNKKNANKKRGNK